MLEKVLEYRWDVLVIIILWIVALTVLCGCGMFEVESPRPEAYQTEAAKEIVTTNVPVIVAAQTNKQDNIKYVAEKAFLAMRGEPVGTDTVGEGERTMVTNIQAEAITNIAANAFGAIERANGTERNLSKIMGSTNKSILEMSMAEYIAYTGAQGAVALDNREKLYKGIETVKGLATSAIATYTGGGIGAGCLIAFGLKMLSVARRRGKLLKATGKGVEEFAASNPVAGKVLKENLAKKAAVLPVDAKKEFDI